MPPDGASALRAPLDGQRTSCCVDLRGKRLNQLSLPAVLQPARVRPCPAPSATRSPLWSSRASRAMCLA
eukprot:14572936-Alexandrium_andersonii.AAC.1